MPELHCSTVDAPVSAPFLNRTLSENVDYCIRAIYRLDLYGFARKVREMASRYFRQFTITRLEISKRIAFVTPTLLILASGTHQLLLELATALRLPIPSVGKFALIVSATYEGDMWA
jgi:hypothetical protein